MPAEDQDLVIWPFEGPQKGWLVPARIVQIGARMKMREATATKIAFAEAYFRKRILAQRARKAESE